MATKKERKAAAQMLGREGGRQRAENLTPERMRQIASGAAKARWNKSKNGNSAK